MRTALAGKCGAFVVAALVAWASIGAARAEPQADRNWSAELPAGWQPLEEAAARRFLVRSDVHQLAGYGESEVVGYLDGDPLAPRGILLFVSSPAAEGALPLDLRQLEQVLAERGTRARDAKRLQLASGHQALHVAFDLPDASSGRALAARALVAAPGAGGSFVAMWVGPREESGTAFDGVVASLRLEAASTRLQRFAVWGSLALSGLVLMGVVVYRIRGSAPRGRVVHFGTGPGSSEPSSIVRAVDGLPTYRGAGDRSGSGGTAARTHSLPPTSLPGLKSTL